MAQFVFDKAQLVVEYLVGTNDKGDNVFKTKTFANIRNSATADQLQAVSDAFGTLCNDPVTGTYSTKRSLIQ